MAPADVMAFTVTKPLFEQFCLFDEDSYLTKPFLSRLVPPSYLTPQGCCRQICLRAHRTNPLHVGYSDIIYGPGLRKTQRPI